MQMHVFLFFLRWYEGGCCARCETWQGQRFRDVAKKPGPFRSPPRDSFVSPRQDTLVPDGAAVSPSPRMGRLMPRNLTVGKKLSSNTFRRRKVRETLVDEPEVAAETAQRETQEVQVPVPEDAAPQVRFAAAAALYVAWATALCDSIDRYFFGSTRVRLKQCFFPFLTVF
jgi:hypothetical protein